MDVVLNEVLYDPAGADGGYEFVELASVPGADPQRSLEGWVIETGNGADGSWRVAWTGAPGSRLRGGLFVLGESGVEPAPDVVADLDLQNGPDACRLRAPGGQVDRLGWGEPLPPSLYEGSPAGDTGTGEALARRPDARDTGDNRADFVAAPPTPGAFNSPDRSLRVELFEAPPLGWPPGTAWEFRWRVRNDGRSDWSGPVRSVCSVHPGEVLAEAWVAGIGSGAAAELRVEGAPPPGAHLPRSLPEAVGTGGEPVAWCGAGSDLVITEVYPRPPPDEPEWIEIRVTGTRAVDLGALRLADAAGSAADPVGILAAGDWAVITADPAAVRERWNPPAGLIAASPWPSLNHTGSGIAERIVLSAAGEVVAAAAWSGGIGEGVSWEIASTAMDPEDPASWGASLDPQGATPGRENSRNGDRPVPGPAAVLVAHPSPYRPGRDGTVLVVVRPRRAVSRCRVEVFDSAGYRVAELAPWRHGVREHRAAWDGRTDQGEAAPLGLYLVRAEVPGQLIRPAPLVLVR